jgi:hypothetical protein
MTQLTRSITKDEVAIYHRAGVVLLRDILPQKAINALRRSIDEAIRSISESPSGYDLSSLTRAVEAGDWTVTGDQHKIAGMLELLKASGKPLLLDETENTSGRFLVDTGIAARLKEFRQFSLRGPGPEVAAALLNSNNINFHGDQIFIKEANTRERTAFHQDATYLEIEGDQCCVLWIPVDPATFENGTMLYVRGSHRDTKLYQPNVLVAQTPLPGARGDLLPDIEGHMDDFDIVYFDVEPGDILAHHYRTIHGAGGNHSRYQVRRAASLRYCGDDVRFQTRPWAPRELHHTRRLNDGDPLHGPDFPVVWRRDLAA